MLTKSLGLCPSGSLSRGRVFVQAEGLCPGGLCPGVSVSMKGKVSVQGGSLSKRVSVLGKGLCPGGVCVQEVSVQWKAPTETPPILYDGPVGGTHPIGILSCFKCFGRYISHFTGPHTCFGLLATSALGFKARVDSPIYMLLGHNGFLRYTSGATPADLLAAIYPLSFICFKAEFLPSATKLCFYTCL